MTLLEKTRQFEKENQAPVKEQPAFHAAPAVGWMNDPNGFSWYDGQYHLFYQYCPNKMKWGPMHWGHQVSDDLVVWKRKPCVMAPENSFDYDGCFSGTAIETDQGHLLIYTGVTGSYQNQCIALGDGLTYKKFEGNPVIKGDQLPDGCSHEDFRDPKIWKEKDTYYCIIGNMRQDKHGQIVMFTSKNLTDWKYEGILYEMPRAEKNMLECPGFFRMDGIPVLITSPQNMHADGKEFHNGHNSVYLLGKKDTLDFSGATMHSIDYGLDFYAPETTIAPDGREILIGWMASWHGTQMTKEQTWTTQMTFPRELSLEEDMLIQKPVAEIENYYLDTIKYSGKVIEGEVELPEVKGRFFDMGVHFNCQGFKKFTIELAKNERFKTTFTISNKKKQILLDRTYSGMLEDHNCIRKVPFTEEITDLRILMDQYGIEIFVNGGKMVFSLILTTPISAEGIAFKSKKAADIDVTFHTIDTASIYRKREAEGTLQ